MAPDPEVDMLAHTDLPITDVASVLANFPGLIAPWPGARWTWDLRYACASTVVRIEDWAPVEVWLARSFAMRFDAGLLAQLSPRQRSSLARYGGVRSGQHGYVDPDGFSALRLALVWPWTDGQHISLRLALG
jgi:hypothetical protein